MEFIILALFACGLLACLAFNISILAALCFGYALFFYYGLRQHFSPRELLSLSLAGIKTVRTILIAFVFIGMLTASWRACGTIATIIYYSSAIMIPSAFLVITFLLNCFVSVLTGTSFGTMATIGVICMTIGNIMGIDPAFLGGASLSGIYFGDRCSPMSTSALLVAGLTKTDLYTNIKLMMRTAAVPFILTCVIYIALGMTTTGELPHLELLHTFRDYFNLSLWTLLPAAVIIIMSACRINVIKTMAVSTLTGAIISLCFQDMSSSEILDTLITGFHATDPYLAAMMDGGGIASMLNVGAIVCISASYFDIFDKTGLLHTIESHIQTLSRRISLYGGAIIVSILTSMISCNQSLASMLSYQLCKCTIPNNQQLAITLENTAIVIAPMIPWNIAGAVPIDTWNVPTTAILFATYLYLIPLWNLLTNLHKN